MTDISSFRMVIDGAFFSESDGPVITGTVQTGVLQVGDEIEIVTELGEHMTASAERIETFGKKIDIASPGQQIMVFLRNQLSIVDLIYSSCGGLVFKAGSVSAQPAESESGEWVIQTQSDSTPRQGISDHTQTRLKKSVPLFLLEFINSISLPQIKSGNENYSKMVLTINGYDNDARPLWDIPEVVEWYRELHTKYPYMPLFLSPGSVQVYFQVLGPISSSIIPAEYRDKDELVGLLLHTLSERNKYFSTVLGSDYDRCQAILNTADRAVTNAVTNLAKGIEEPLL
jgi:hypothetical protein